jgi:hypothetical protein
MRFWYDSIRLCKVKIAVWFEPIRCWFGSAATLLLGEGKDFAGSRGIRRYWDQWGVRLGLLSPGLRQYQGGINSIAVLRLGV